MKRFHPTGRKLIVVAVIFLLSVTTIGGIVAGEVDSAERSINQTNINPGETVRISIEIQIAHSGDRMSVEEFFDPSFSDATIEGVTHNNNSSPPVAAFADGEDGLLVALEPDGGFAPNDTVVITYTVTAAENASDEMTYRINGQTTIDDNEPVAHTGDSEITVSIESTPTPTTTQTRTSESTPVPKQTQASTQTSNSTPNSTATLNPTSATTRSTQVEATPTQSSTRTDQSVAPASPETTAPTDNSTDADGSGLGPVFAVLAVLLAVGRLRLTSNHK